MREAGEFLGFVATVLGVEPGTISLETAYGSIPAWDSVMHLRLVMEVEARFKIDLPLEVVPTLTTLGAFYDRVKGARA